jgi:hypothetical protein
MNDFLGAGRLEDHPFAALAGLILQESRTGELILESGNRRRTVWFLGGNPVAVVSADPQDHLAQFLLEHGKISDDDARRIANLPETREALGSVDILPKETLNWGVKSRFVNLCYDLFRWEDGDYRFQECDPPRELFLLKVPAHSLIFKGVGLLGQAAVFDAAPDDAVCGAGPVSPADARYLSPDAIRLLEQCRPGGTVAEALDGSAVDRDQARRLLYALTCLGLVALSRGPDASMAAAPAQDEGPGFILDEADVSAAVPTPAPGEPGVNTDLAEFSLNLPPLGAEYDIPAAPGSEFDPTSISQEPGGYPFTDESGPGSFGSFGQDETFGQQDAPPDPTEGRKQAPLAPAKRSGRRFHLPRIVGITIGSLAAAGIIGFAGWWWMSGSEPPSPTVKPPVNRPAPTAAAPVAALPVPVPAPAPTPLTQAAAPPTPPATPPPAPAIVNPAPRAATVSPGASAADRYRSGLEIFRGGDLSGAAATWEALLADEYRGAFTLQLLTACQHDTIKEAQRSLGAQNLFLVTKKVNGRVCYRICIGTFESREAAGRALAGLPGEYRTAGAVRPVADVLERDR